jgi:hypothetical protein
MKNLDLNAYGVSELRDAEMRDTNGGGMFRKVLEWVVTCFAWESINNPTDVANAFNEGATKACAVEI